MKWMLFFILAGLSMQVAADPASDVKGCVSRVAAVLKIDEIHTGPDGFVTARCMTVVNNTAKDGYYYFDQCVHKGAPGVSKLEQKIALLNSCVRSAKDSIANAAGALPVVDPTSKEDCEYKVRNSGLTKAFADSVMRKLGRRPDMQECGKYLSCIQKGIKADGIVWSTIQSCVDEVEGSAGGAAHPVSRQGISP